MKKIFETALLMLLLGGLKASAQTYEVPQNYVLKAKEDYPKYEADVIKTVDWLQQTSWSEDPEKRQQANAFLVAWLTGSPDVTIDVGKNLADLADKNPALLITYMGGFTKYMLEHKDARDTKKADLFAITMLLAKYQQEAKKSKDNDVEKLIKAQKEGTLEDWVATKLHS